MKKAKIPRQHSPSRPELTEDYFRQRAHRGKVAKAKRILRRAGRGRPPQPGDEL